MRVGNTAKVLTAGVEAAGEGVAGADGVEILPDAGAGIPGTGVVARMLVVVGCRSSGIPGAVQAAARKQPRRRIRLSLSIRLAIGGGKICLVAGRFCHNRPG